MGISNEFRVLGGSIGLAICANILNNNLTNRLQDLLSPDQMKALLASAQALALIPPELRELVRATFMVSFIEQVQVIELRRRVTSTRCLTGGVVLHA
jgi:hypothetical protein